ncbi:TIGR03089 family protein, partial [Gordonia sp. (in: high G+C Gram-positive bacteria)]|uniref:TIGR03089 family protein n=1 Tax=Gordonia sp. (in: high G+C Gram-positive bacteria) TaxID=84139 RepID=UPI0035B3E19A
MRELTPNTVTDAIFAAVTDHSRPLLTYYDDATGERTELSAATLGNWAAKTANYLRDEIGVAEGDVVAVDLP